MNPSSTIVGEATSLSDESFNFVRDLIHQQAALVLEPHKAYLVLSRLASLARSEGAPSVDAFLKKLRGQRVGLLHGKIVEAMTTNETLFFRDPPAFDALRLQIIPQLIKQRSTQKSLNIWSAASSTGQEPYSLALMFREFFPELSSWDIRIFATDVSNEVLEVAKKGQFSQIEVNRGLPATLLVKYFRKVGTRWLIRDDIRQMVTFAPCNLAGEWPSMLRFDLILLRNVLIYFNLATKRSIIARAYRGLKRDGVLLLGNGETMINIDAGFERMTYNKAVYYTPKG